MNLTSEINELRNVAQHIAAKLEAFVLDGTIPPGTRLIQTKVADQFGVSRLPVRDAFAMLIKSELAVALPRKGIMVRPISVRDVRELFEMRRIIEAAAIRKSAPLLSASDLSTARTLISAQAQVDPAKDFAGLLAADERFHCLLWSRCGNQEMEAALSRVWNRIKLLRAQARGLPEWQKTSVQHHEQILAAIESRRFDDAVSLVTAGITRSEEELVGVIERATTPAR